MIQQLPILDLTWKKILLAFLLIPFSLIIFPFLFLIFLAALLRTLFFGSKRKEEKYTEEDAIKDFHMDPPGWK